MLCGIASGICFIAARELETTELGMYSRLSTEYSWSFYMHWGATVICVIANFVMGCLVKHAPDDIESAKYYYYAG